MGGGERRRGQNELKGEKRFLDTEIHKYESSVSLPVVFLCLELMGFSQFEGLLGGSSRCSPVFHPLVV